MIEINRDYEVDDDGEVGSGMHTYWADGHGFNGNEFLEAVMHFCLFESESVPRFEVGDVPIEEMWQIERPVHGGSVIFERTPDQPPETRRGDKLAKPITIMDFEVAPRRGSPKCCITDCNNPWYMTSPLRVVVEVGAPYTSIQLPTCREHRKMLPDPYYRGVLVPVGATVVLEPKDQ